MVGLVHTVQMIAHLKGVITVLEMYPQYGVELPHNVEKH